MEKTQATIEIFSHTIACSGEWTLASIQKLTEQIDNLTFPVTTILQIDLRLITHLDTGGAWLVNHLIECVHHQKIATTIIAQDKTQENLLHLVQQASPHNAVKKNIPPLSFVEQLGKEVFERLMFFVSFLSFVGEMSVLAFKELLMPWRLQWAAIASTIEFAGCYALPILGLLSFLIGIVLTYQMGLQLRNYGAAIYIVDLLGLSILREFGPLITAIIVAGRTSSAFAAEMGTMMVNEEVDALKTMGINPIAYLGLPKLFGMLIVMPLLGVWADMFGMCGGMMMAKSMLGLSFVHFFDRFREVISLKNYVIGLVKTPVFAMIITAVGCFQGFQTTGRADSVGRQTTKSVVQAIFLIIIVDAGFSVLFSWAKL